MTELREHLHASGIILIVFGGDRGDGFSAQLPVESTEVIAEVLENVARQIRESGPLAS